MRRAWGSWTSLTLAAAAVALLAAGLAPAAPAATQPAQPGAAAAAPLRLVTAPLNPAFVQYRNRRAAMGPHAELVARRLGLIPSPIDFGYLKTTATVPQVAGSPYPTTYDLRNADPSLSKQSPIEDQGIYGSCWAFASIGSLESCLLPADPQRFSENNLILKSGFDGDPYDNGGDDLMAAAYFARWSGPVDIAADTYGSPTPNGLAPIRHVQDVAFLPSRTGPLDNDTIKAAIMAYGGVYTDIYADDGMINSSDSASFNASTSAYCYRTYAYVNHAVDIVGWDDTYPAANFATTANGNTPAPGDGAFIARNSWGTGWGDGGYFYASYYDSTIGYGESSPMAVFDAAQATTNYNRIYQYDPLGWTGRASLGSGSGDTAWFANRFLAQATGQLVAVSFYASQPGSSYVVYMGSDPATRQLAGSGTIDSAGYHTVTLDTPAQLTVGQYFTIAVQLTTPGDSYPIPLEEKITGYSSGVTSAPGESYISADGQSWTDLTTMGTQYTTANVCLKAFAQTTNTSDVTPPVTKVSGADSLWHNLARTVSFTASDEVGGSGFGYTQYSVDGGPWQIRTLPTASVTIAAPATHANDGVHTIRYCSDDASGNLEATHTCVVNIDTRRPTPAAPRAVSAARGSVASLPFLIHDVRPGSVNATATIKIRTLSGKWRKTIVLRGQLMNRTLSCRFTCSLPAGTYRFTVYATDAAGNPQTAPATNLLRVH